MTDAEKIDRLSLIQEVTTKNVDTLTTDIKDLINAMPQFARVDEKYKSMDIRLKRLESVLSWASKITSGVLLTALLGLVVLKP